MPKENQTNYIVHAKCLNCGYENETAYMTLKVPVKDHSCPYCKCTGYLTSAGKSPKKYSFKACTSESSIGDQETTDESEETKGKKD